MYPDRRDQAFTGDVMGPDVTTVELIMVGL